MEQKEPSVLSPEGSFTFGGVGREENEGEDVALLQMQDDLALCTAPTHHPPIPHLLQLVPPADPQGPTGF